MDNSLTVQNFMPALTFQDVANRRNQIVEFAKQVMVKDTDFGEIPGTNKPTLFKPGAEKLCTLFGLSPRFTIVKSVEDWTGKDFDGEPFFYYLYHCALYRGDYAIGEGDGSCNSHESKYRYRWVSEQNIPANVDKNKSKTRGGRISEFIFAIEKSETTGQYGKPANYWQQFKDAIANKKATLVHRKTKSGKEMDAWEIDSTLYCVPNEDVADLANTILKMSQKRALIAATLISVNASEFFTQDIEDMVIDAEYKVIKETEVGKKPEPQKQESHSAVKPNISTPQQAVAKAQQLKAEKGEPIALIAQLKVTAREQFAKYAGKHPTQEQAEKLAAVVTHALDAKYSADEKELLRHQLYQRIGDVGHGKELDLALAATMQTRWCVPSNHYEANDVAKNEIALLLVALQEENGQATFA